MYFKNEFIRRKNEPDKLSHALETGVIDSSEFILLATGILEQKLGKAIKDEVTQIRHAYFELDKDKALKLIGAICENNPEIKDNQELYKLLQNAKNNIVDNPVQNQSRRYFETKFATLILHSHGTPNESPVFYDGMQKLSDLVKELNPALYAQDIAPGPSKNVQVSTIETVKTVVGVMRELGDATPVITDKRKIVRLNSPVVATKDRLDKAIKGTDEHNQIFSKNPGIMKSTHGMPHDERKEEEKNRIVDSYGINTAIKDGYSASHKHVPFVNSVSGTAFSSVMTIGAFITRYSGDTNMQQHVDNILQTLICHSVFSGYHSLGEWMDVIRQPAVQNVLTSQPVHGKPVELAVTYPEDILEQSFKEATQYSIKICLNRLLKEELSGLRGDENASENMPDDKPGFGQ